LVRDFDLEAGRGLGVTSDRASTVDLPVPVLEADARFHRERLALYRARRYGPRATSEVRFRELERAVALAEQRLRARTGSSPS
jgi:hypothetical protein